MSASWLASLRASSRFFLACLAAAAALLATAPGAHALVGRNPVMDAKWDAIVTELAKGSPATRSAALEAVLPAATETAVMTAPPGSKASTVADGLMRARLRSGVFGAAIKGAGVAGLLFATAETGWKIGRTIDQLWLTAEPLRPAAYAATGAGWRYFDPSNPAERAFREPGYQVTNSTTPVFPQIRKDPASNATVCGSEDCLVKPTSTAEDGNKRWFLTWSTGSSNPREGKLLWDQAATVNNPTLGPDLCMAHGGCQDTAGSNGSVFAPAVAQAANVMQGLIDKYKIGSIKALATITPQRGVGWEHFTTWQQKGQPPFTLPAVTISATTAQMEKQVRIRVKQYTNQSDPTGGYWPAPQTATMPSDAEIRERFRTALADEPDAAAFLNAALEPDEFDSPLEARVPQCYGDAYADCVAKFETAGFTVAPVRTRVDWREADVEVGPSRVIELEPLPGTRVKTDVAVKIKVNPLADDMPAFVPDLAPGADPGESARKLREAGLVPKVEVLSTPDPSQGPDVVTAIAPAPKTRLKRGQTVTLKVNPSNAPPPAGGGGGGGINLGPLNKLTPCDTFPFGVPCWFAEALGAWVTEPEAPSFRLTFPFVSDADRPLVDLSIWDPFMPALRALILAVATLLQAWAFMNLVLNRGGDRDD